ncbi:MAG: PQQ-binding-like beta-propeller repeat protein [Planctomycetota bacterium]
MRVRPASQLLLPLLAAVLPAQAEPPRPGTDWPQFRGIQASGVGDGTPLPSEWNVAEDRGVRWRTAVPGLSHASPIVWGNRIFVATAVPSEGDPELKIGLYGAGDSADDMVEHSFELWCLSLERGDVLWRQTAAKAVPRFKRHTKASHANATPVTDGESVVVLFGSQGLFCYDVDGTLRWQAEVGDLDVGPHDSLDLEWGFASSPVIAGNRVIVQADIKNDPYLAAWDLTTGEQAWRTSRDDLTGWATPTCVATSDDGIHVVVNGCKHMGAYRLEDGAEVWRMAGGGGLPIPTPLVTDDLYLLTSNHRPIEASHPRKPLFAVKRSAEGTLPLPSEAEPGEHVAWLKARVGNYIQTPIVYRGLIYLCAANGILSVVDPASGERIKRQRLGEGDTGFSASPVAGDGKLYFTSEEGEVFAVAAGAELEVLAQNPLGEICMATPAVASGTLVFRTLGHVVAIADG